jgi:hypothetical protein
MAISEPVDLPRGLSVLQCREQLGRFTGVPERAAAAAGAPSFTEKLAFVFQLRSEGWEYSFSDLHWPGAPPFPTSRYCGCPILHREAGICFSASE